VRQSGEAQDRAALVAAHMRRQRWSGRTGIGHETLAWCVAEVIEPHRRARCDCVRRDRGSCHRAVSVDAATALVLSNDLEPVNHSLADECRPKVLDKKPRYLRPGDVVWWQVQTETLGTESAAMNKRNTHIR
jgi:hypothetical protein